MPQQCSCVAIVTGMPLCSNTATMSSPGCGWLAFMKQVANSATLPSCVPPAFPFVSAGRTDGACAAFSS